MEISVLLAEQITVLFLMGLVGFLAVKAGKFKEEDSRIVSNAVVYICSPCVIINAFQITFTPDKLKGLLLAGGAAVLVHIILIGGGKLLSGPLHLNGIEKASVEYSNAGNLIVPLVSSVLGEEWVFYTTAYIIVQTVLIWTHGQSVIRQGQEKDYRKILLNPNIIAIAVGFILFATGIHLPSVVGQCISGFGDMIGPASMLVVGMIIGNVNLGWVFRQKRPYLICFMRLVLFPVITILIFALSGAERLHPDAEYILMVVLLATSAPVAVMVTQLAQIHGRDARYASVINVMSVIFCIVTMPLMVLLYEAVI
jgi:hypothetical protein